MPKEYEKFARGVDYAVEGKFLYLKIDTDAAKSETSGTGKMKLTCSTGGFRSVDGTKDYRVNVMGGYKNGK
jgi:hypothetical protein